MPNNSLKQLESLGQSIWLDYIRRDLLTSGELARYIEEDGLRGMTSNPAIFEKAIAGSHDYDETIHSLARQGLPPGAIYEQLSQRDVQDAADLFRTVYDRTAGQDGYVSLEVDPHLAHDTGRTLAEARRLWAALGRPNVMIKVPGTREGLPAIRTLITEGVNINVTLLFSLDRYRDVLDAYLGGLEARLAQGAPLERIASVASFFVSRIDAMVDPELHKIAQQDPGRKAQAEKLAGQVAIANAKMAYRIYQEMLAGNRFIRLGSHGARPQRLLWASTSTKDPLSSDVKYVEALIGPDTVNTVPPETLAAYRDHGQPALRLTADLASSEQVLEQLPELGIQLDAVTQRLEEEGVSKFTQPFDQLMETLRRASKTARK